MILSEQIREIVWHEIGHLCLDIILVKKIKSKKLKITELQIHHLNVIDGPKWGGHVEVLPGPSYIEVVKDINYFGLKLLTLYSGCLFQNLYHKKILKNDYEIKNCFCLREGCIGRKDWSDYNSLVSEFTAYCDKKNSIRGNKEIFQFFESYPKSLKFYNFFIKCINKIVLELSDKIELDYINKEKPAKYCYPIKEQELLKLRKKLHWLVCIFIYPQVIIQCYKFKKSYPNIIKAQSIKLGFFQLNLKTKSTWNPH